MSYVFSFTFFSLPLIFSLHWWPLAFLILSPPLQNFHVVLPTKICLLWFLSLTLHLCRPEEKRQKIKVFSLGRKNSIRLKRNYLKWSSVNYWRLLIKFILLFIYCLIPRVDINECTDGSHNCGDASNCENIPGSFFCICKLGFTNDGTQCEGKWS